MLYSIEEIAKIKISCKAIVCIIDDLHLYKSKYAKERLNYYLKQLHNLITEKGKENEQLRTVPKES